MLYRGVNKIVDQGNNGRLLPRGNKSEVTALYDGKFKHDGKLKYSPCQSNTARAHHIESGLYDGCGVSTTRDEKLAVFFATFGYIEDGYVYVIDESLLKGADVSYYEFSDPLYPEEKEVTLIHNECKSIPNRVIVDKYAVNIDGSRVLE